MYSRREFSYTREWFLKNVLWIEFEISTPRYSFSSCVMKRNRSYPATEQTQHVWRKFIIKDQKPNLYFGLLEIYWVILTSCSCLSPGPDTWLSTSTYGEYFLNAVVSVECIFYLGSLNILSAANPHLFAFLVHSYHCFKGSCASKVTACLRCCLCPHATPSECRDRGLPAAATHMAIETWGAKTRCLLTETCIATWEWVWAW